jgi:hypothetical protein
MILHMPAWRGALRLKINLSDIAEAAERKPFYGRGSQIGGRHKRESSERYRHQQKPENSKEASIESR